MKLSILTFTILQSGVIGLSLAQVLPSELSSMLVQLPIVGLFAWYVLYSNKQNREWSDHSLETQDERHQRTIELFEKIFDRMDNRQGELVDSMKENSKQLTMNTAVVNESMRQGELAEEIKKLIGDRNV